MRYARKPFTPILIVLCLSLASCNSMPPATVPLSEPDQSMMQPPPKAPRLDDSEPLLLGGLVMAEQELAQLYNECRVITEGLQKYIRTLIERTKEKP